MSEKLKVVYDKSSSVILYTLYQADVTKLNNNEGVVEIPLHYAKTFSSFEDCCRTISQLAAAFDPK